MTEPLFLGLRLATRLLSRVQDVKKNHAECQLLEDVVEHTLNTLQSLDGRMFDSATNNALELVNGAITTAQETVDKYCQANLLCAWLYQGSYATELKRASGLIEKALLRIPVASLGLAADTQSDLAALSSRISDTKFGERASIAHHSMYVMSAVERLSNRSGQENAEMKQLINKILTQNDFNFEEVKKELNFLQHELDRLERKGDEAPRVMASLEDSLRCPMSKETMKNPVLLKDSGMTYDRSSIDKWIRRGCRYDPITDVELLSTELIPNVALQDACERFLKLHGTSSSAVETPQTDETQPRLSPGLYEAHGKIEMGSSTLHVFQLLILDPSDRVVSCTIYRDTSILGQANNVETGIGKWIESAFDMSIKDPKFDYNGSISLEPNYGHPKMKWKGRVSNCANRSIHEFNFVYTPPPIQRVLWPRPGILQMTECAVFNQGIVEYKSELVVMLEADATAIGWMYFKSSLHESNRAGVIGDGTWDLDGNLEFKLCFPEQNAPLYPYSERANYDAKFHVRGNFVQNEGVLPPSFSAKIAKIVEERTSSSTPLEGVEVLEYRYLREASTSWFQLQPNLLKLFQTPTNYKLESGDYFIRAEFDSNEGCATYYLQAREWRSDSIPQHYICVSWLNSTKIQQTTSWNSTDIWRIERSSYTNRYKVSLGKRCQDLNGYVGHVGKTLSVRSPDNVNENQIDCHLFVVDTSRTEAQCEWTIKERDGGLYLALEADHNSAILGNNDYFLTYPVPESDEQESRRPRASLSQDPRDALRITFEQSTE